MDRANPLFSQQTRPVEFIHPESLESLSDQYPEKGQS